MGVQSKKSSSAMTVEQLESLQSKGKLSNSSSSSQAGEPTIIINNNIAGSSLSDSDKVGSNLSEIGVSEISGTFPVTGYVIPTNSKSSGPAIQNRTDFIPLSGNDDATLLFCISYLISRGYNVESPGQDVKEGSFASILNSKKDAIFKIVTAPAANIIQMIDSIRELF